LLALPLLVPPVVVLPELLTDPLVAVCELLFVTEIEVLFVLVIEQLVFEFAVLVDPGPVFVIEILVEFEHDGVVVPLPGLVELAATPS
jgi:hypothetical protein